MGLTRSAGLLQSIIEDPLMRHSAILVFANKQDLVSDTSSQICFSAIANVYQ